MAPRYLNLSELARVRWLASEAMRRRRPRKAGRVRAFAMTATPHPEPRPHGPVLPVPLPRRPLAASRPRRWPLETAPLQILQMLLTGLRQLGVAF
ncbi:hypothetical protein [Nocardiopsis metallicus]|uniref:Uncharacterized protein n=1 Tax=Nocardiopsis metallicus TaxID=179819 RepID=A0A840WEE6_9ACTN|nr:hypothetical protein [Nocardiopsis metallicus]MBB5494494.1 hypothetical protein [Nocardiopsis metallicus]